MIILSFVDLKEKMFFVITDSILYPLFVTLKGTS